MLQWVSGSFSPTRRIKAPPDPRSCLFFVFSSSNGPSPQEPLELPVATMPVDSGQFQPPVSSWPYPGPLGTLRIAFSTSLRETPASWNEASWEQELAVSPSSVTYCVPCCDPSAHPSKAGGSASTWWPQALERVFRMKAPQKSSVS